MKLIGLPLKEQETLVMYDPFDKTVNIYTSELITYKHILKRIGKPYKLDCVDNHFYSAEWMLSYIERENVAKATSITAILKKVTKN